MELVNGGRFGEKGRVGHKGRFLVQHGRRGRRWRWMGQEVHFAFDDDDDADVVFVVVVVVVVFVVVRTIVVKTEIGEEKRVGVVCDGEEDEWK